MKKSFIKFITELLLIEEENGHSRLTVRKQVTVHVLSGVFKKPSFQ